MTSDTEHIRRQVEETRRELSNDVNALTEKVTPSRIVERRVHRVSSRLADFKDRIMGTAYSATDTVSDKVSGTTDRVGDRVSDMASGAADTVRSAPQTVRRQAEGNPLAAGLVAFGLGWLVSSLLPPTRKEQELAMQAKDVAAERLQPVAEKVQQAAVEVKDNLREPAQHAVESVKETASEAADRVTEEGKQATRQVTDDAKQAADDTRSRTSGSSSQSTQSSQWAQSTQSTTY